MILVEILVLKLLVQRNTVEVVLAVRTEVCTIVELEHIVAGTCSFFGSDVSFLIFFLDDDRPLKLLALDRLLVADDVSDGETFTPEFQTTLQPDSLQQILTGCSNLRSSLALFHTSLLQGVEYRFCLVGMVEIISSLCLDEIHL